MRPARLAAMRSPTGCQRLHASLSASRSLRLATRTDRITRIAGDFGKRARPQTHLDRLARSTNPTRSLVILVADDCAKRDCDRCTKGLKFVSAIIPAR